MKTVYVGEFKSKEDVESDFEVELTDEQIIYAEYETPSYEGYAFVLFEKDGKLYEVNGSHCSCNGLEGQWSPEETSIKFLREIIKNGKKYEVTGSILEKTLNEYEKENHASN